MARDGSPFGIGAEAAYLRANRGNRSGIHLQSAREYRRRTQLGLPLYLDSGCSVYALCSDADRVHQRGFGVHELDREPLPRAQTGWIVANYVWD